MKQVIAVVKPFRAQAVLEAIAEVDVEACQVAEAKGYGRQKSYLSRYVGSEYNLAYLPKVEIRVWVRDEWAERISERIAAVARTGRIGDGKIVVLPALFERCIEV